ncbi:hypothetical protein KR044_001101, partial [Drosophila immigrans]
MRSKISKLYVESFTFSTDVVAFSETWLSSDISDSELFPSKYTIYRQDRSSRRGGGVLFAVDSNFSSQPLH